MAFVQLVKILGKRLNTANVLSTSLKLLCFLVATTAIAEDRILIIDTGFSRPSINVNLCPDGHFDFTNNTPTVGKDRVRHGTNIAEILANIPNTCLVIYKAWPGHGDGYVALLPRVMKKLKASGIKYVNVSIVGNAPIPAEQNMFKELKDVKIFVAAGNDSLDLDKNCNSYPACYRWDNIYTTGSKDAFSNHGSVVKYIDDSYYNGGRGTSYASPRTLRKIYERDVSPNSNAGEQPCILRRQLPGSSESKLQSLVRTVGVRCSDNGSGRSGNAERQ